MKSSSTRSVDNEREKLKGWEVLYEGFDPSLEDLRETLCTLGNGYMGIRGAATESSASKIHYPGTYLAGIYNTLGTDVSGKRIFNEDMVNCPNCMLLSFRVNKDKWNEEEKIEILSYSQKLDMKKGLLIKSRRVRDEAGHVSRIEEKRLVHMKHPHLATLSYTITPENYSGKLLVRSFIDGAVQNMGVARYGELNSKHLKLVSRGSVKDDLVCLTMKTNTSGITISEASRLRIYRGSRKQKLKRKIIKKKEKIGSELTVQIKKNSSLRLEKTCAVFTSRDVPSGSVEKHAVNTARKAPAFKSLLRSQEEAWKKLWQICDIRIEEDLFAETILRFHMFHLMQSASPHNTEIDAALAARGLHGESYRGHIFWDEVFVLPFVSTHLPRTAEALLMYRYRRLGPAREYAKENGYEGAMFPWQSGSSGHEETQSIHLNPMSGKWGPDLSRNQRHVSFSIAYNVWRNWVITGNRKFLADYGAELILSIAKFGSSLCVYDEEDGRYHTEGLMGPDEFHEKLPFSRKAGFRDNFYSNMLIVWMLMKAREVLEILPADRRRQLRKKIGISEKELQRWEDISRKMNVIINEKGIISQFKGYFDLKELDWEAYRKKYKNIHRMDRILKAEGKSPDDYKVAKQADVLMLFYLIPFNEIKDLFERLGYKITKRMLRDNYEYYETRTSHGSTLSKVVHCYVSHILGMRKASREWFFDVLEADIHDVKGGTTLEGIHTGIMGGSIDIAIRGFAGVHIAEDHVKIEPRLPSGWDKMDFRMLIRGLKVRLIVSKKSVKIKIETRKSRTKGLTFRVAGRERTLKPGGETRMKL
ncbi:MAG: beta-phosphoglucomutase [Candidatus Omnitrophica bacterium]|nr:beta-phosphoglucomutase [Candidatus Omnitrophota bacterium]